MTPQTCINTARAMTNDADSLGFRQSNDELVKFFNDGLKECVKLSPEHFKTTGDFTCTPDITEQAIDYPDAVELLAVIRIKNGKAVHEMDMGAMNKFHPDWAADAAGIPQNWAKI